MKVVLALAVAVWTMLPCLAQVNAGTPIKEGIKAKSVRWSKACGRKIGAATARTGEFCQKYHLDTLANTAGGIANTGRAFYNP